MERSIVLSRGHISSIMNLLDMNMEAKDDALFDGIQKMLLWRISSMFKFVSSKETVDNAAEIKEYVQ